MSQNHVDDNGSILGLSAALSTSNAPPTTIAGVGADALHYGQAICLLLNDYMGGNANWSFSTDGSLEDFNLSRHLVAVPRARGVGREQTLLPRDGAIDLAWVKISQAGADAVSTADLERVIDGINLALNADRFDVLNEVYRNASVSDMATETIIAFLRVPFMGRHRIKEWRGFRERAAAEFGGRGLDVTRLMRGLM